MRIAILADSWLFDPMAMVNGTQVQLYHLVSAFCRRGHEVHYIAATRDRGRLADLPDGVRFHWIERPVTAISWVRDLSQYRDALDRIRPDALYQRGRSHLTWVAARWARAHGCRFVWGSNGEDSCTRWKSVTRLHSSDRSRLKKALLSPLAGIRDILIHAGVRRAAHVVTQTSAQAEDLRRNYGKEGLVLPSLFEAQEGATGAKDRVVLWLAALSHTKQPEIFLDLAERCSDLVHWRFALGGGTRVEAYRQRIASRAAPLPNVQLLGPVAFAESHAHYARASLFVSTSRSEGVSNSFIQAWLHGTPVLSLHHDPNGWINGKGLGICACGDKERFLAGGRALLADAELRAAMGKECVRFAKATFAAEETIDAYLALFSRS